MILANYEGNQRFSEQKIMHVKSIESQTDIYNNIVKLEHVQANELCVKVEPPQTEMKKNIETKFEILEDLEQYTRILHF